MFRILIGVGIGILVGGVLGYVGKCRTGACPFMSNPFYGAMLLGALGAFIGWSMAMRQAPPESQAYQKIPLVTTTADFDKAINQRRPVLVDFYATWCGPCKELAPTIGDLSERYAGRVDFIKIDVDQAQDLAGRYNVTSIPRVMIFVNGKLFGEPLEGPRDESEYIAALDKALREQPATAP